MLVGKVNFSGEKEENPHGLGVPFGKGWVVFFLFCSVCFILVVVVVVI